MFVLLGLFVVISSSQQLSADFVYGQGGSFTTATANKGSVSAASLFGPQQITVTPVNDLYVADSGNNRVLAYLYRNSTAFKVYGQSGSFTNVGSGTTADTLRAPRGVAVSSTGDVYIADSSNNRVLYYTITSTTASRVYGQQGNFTAAVANNGGASAMSLRAPFAVTTDASGNLYICDSGNNRVLYYDNGSTTAARVYGQPDFTTVSTAGASNGIPPTANYLNGPFGVTVTPAGVYIADTFYNRVMFYSGTSTTVSRVYGQGGSYTSSAANNGGVSASSLSYPTSVAVNSAGNVYITDALNNRVLFYVGTSTTASAVFGQADFTSDAVQTTSATSLTSPQGVFLDTNGHLYVSQPSEYRITTFDVSSTIPPTAPPITNNVCFHIDTTITYKVTRCRHPNAVSPMCSLRMGWRFATAAPPVRRFH